MKNPSLGATFPIDTFIKSPSSTVTSHETIKVTIIAADIALNIKALSRDRNAEGLFIFSFTTSEILPTGGY